MATTPSAARGVAFPARPAPPAASVRPRAADASRVVRAGADGGGKWWAPLLGWSGRAGYLDAPAPVVVVVAAAAQQDDAAAAAIVRRRFVGALTEEKARELRARMAQTESFNDAMYHSAIGSRLARSG